jgi:hypothetical protein
LTGDASQSSPTVLPDNPSLAGFWLPDFSDPVHNGFEPDYRYRLRLVVRQRVLSA